MMPLSVAALTNARKPNFSSLIFTDVKTPTGNSADYKQTAADDDLGRMGIVARTEDIFFSPPTGRSSERTTTAVVAEINNDADRYLRMIVNGRPLAGSVMQAAENFGAITLRDGSTQSTVELLPFDGDAYGVFAFVESVLLANEAQSNERLSLTQRAHDQPNGPVGCCGPDSHPRRSGIALYGGERVRNTRARTAPHGYYQGCL